MVYTLAVIGDNLYSASNDGCIKVWRLPSMGPGPTLTSHSEAVRKIRAMPSGDFISGDEAGFVSDSAASKINYSIFHNSISHQMQIWSGEEAKQGYEPIGEEIWDLAVDPEGFVYTARDRDITVWLLKGIINWVLTKLGSSNCDFLQRKLLILKLSQLCQEDLQCAWSKMFCITPPEMA